MVDMWEAYVGVSYTSNAAVLSSAQPQLKLE